jgi:hypothetical protein
VARCVDWFRRAQGNLEGRHLRVAAEQRKLRYDDNESHCVAMKCTCLFFYYS